MNSMKFGRRQLLIGAVGAAAAITRFAGAAERPDDPIIDTHQHLWDLRRFKLPWLANAGERLNRSYLMADYAKAIEGLNVTKAVYMEIGAAAEQKEAEAREVVELCRSGNGPTAAAVIGGLVASDGFAAYIGQFKGNRYVKGVRDPYPRGGFENQKLIAGVRLLGELGMSFDILAGSDLLPEIAKLVAACPWTRFILDHCGNPDVKWFFADRQSQAEARRRRTWEDGVARLAEQKNVVCKISGVAESGEDGKVTAQVVAPAVNYCLDRFGEDRVIFAANWPVCLKTISFKDWVSVLRQVMAGRGAASSRKLFYQNAARFYALGE